MLTWVSIYWFSAAGPAASVRIYYEHTHDKGTVKPPTVPNGISYFPKELIIPPRSCVPHQCTPDHREGAHLLCTGGQTRLIPFFTRNMKAGDTLRLTRSQKSSYQISEKCSEREGQHSELSKTLLDIEHYLALL